ncbi:NlpC/P60 family protein [Leptobacterium flavescens]|uniref:NlpC/P60 family protein n=1 Tax=Leptobacterium flavescens TaxID=472055 RepID=A0A6P0USJ2_9FLAO|nr:C40 family peptidase [Leptobacterium flavescens]NER14789.1 NlpC/P60 family protein [Leptobacterium flavescens]
MKKLALLIIILFAVPACKSSKKASNKDKPRKVVVAPAPEKEVEESNTGEDAEELEKADNIINTALAFRGTRYKYGGTTSKGMDCSGLIYVSFKEHSVPLQRTSYMMAKQGKQIKLKEVKKGDLLFFNTNKSRKRINHVGLVVTVDKQGIKFIHATTSRGVLISSLKEGYWNYAFIEARRIL